MLFFIQTVQRSSSTTRETIVHCISKASQSIIESPEYGSLRRLEGIKNLHPSSMKDCQGHIKSMPHCSICTRRHHFLKCMTTSPALIAKFEAFATAVSCAAQGHRVGDAHEALVSCTQTVRPEIANIVGFARNCWKRGSSVWRSWRMWALQALIDFSGMPPSY